MFDVAKVTDNVASVQTEVAALFATERRIKEKYTQNQITKAEMSVEVGDCRFGIAELVEEYVQSIYKTPSPEATHLYTLHELIMEEVFLRGLGHDVRRELGELRKELYVETINHVLSTFAGSINPHDTTWSLRINGIVGLLGEEPTS